MDLVALLALVAAIVFAFVFKVNTGIVALGVALIVGRLGGLTDKEMLQSFDGKLFLMLFGVMYLFCIAQENKTLEILAKKAVALCKGNVKLFPLIMFLIAAILSAAGPGLISVSALVAAISVALARQSNIDPIKLLPFGTLGSFAGGLSPITPSGVVAFKTAENVGIMGMEAPLMIKMALTCTVFSVILYFFVFKWHKEETKKLGNAVETIPAFTGKQWLTLAGIVVVAALAIIPGLKVDVGLSSFAVAVVLTVFKVAEEGVALKKVPWGTLIMITGVGILINVVTALGGIVLLQNTLNKIMSAGTATAIMTVLAGVMSWFSSASGVVMPTLIPTVTEMTVGVPMELAIGVCIGAHMAALSPLSSCGGLMLSAYSSSEGVTEKDRNRTFVQLFIMSASGVAFAGLLGLLGLYG